MTKKNKTQEEGNKVGNYNPQNRNFQGTGNEFNKISKSDKDAWNKKQHMQIQNPINTKYNNVVAP